MTQALNFTPQAIASMASYVDKMPPRSQHGVRFIDKMLRTAEIFVLPDYGHLFDRDKPMPECAPEVFHPPFPVTALEYSASPENGRRDRYTQCPASKRIALAWHTSLGWPFEGLPTQLSEGVIVASVYRDDATGNWIPVAGAWHLSFNAEWVMPDRHNQQLREELVEDGRVNASVLASRTLPGSLVAIAPEIVEQAAIRFGVEQAMKCIQMDLMDEVNAYSDLCRALACTNVGMQKRAAPAILNKSRLKAGKLPLRDFHILTIKSEEGDAAFAPSGGGGSKRSHLRRGHIRRLSPTRMTWVNSCVVRGARPGFAGKQYSIEAGAPNVE